MFNLPKSIGKDIDKWSMKNISDENVWNPSKEEKEKFNQYVGGRKNDYHVTVKYGLHTENKEEVQKFIDKCVEDTKTKFPFDISLDKVSKFSPFPEYDVIKIGVKSPELMKLNKLICNEFKYTDSYDYAPHITLSYVKPNSCNDLIGETIVSGKINVDNLEFSTPDKKKFDIKVSSLRLSHRDI